MTDSRKLAVALISGGLDSYVSAACAVADGHRLLALSIDYNQRHHVELAAARRIASVLGAERHVVLPLDLSLFGGSALTADIDVPKSGVGDEIPVTYVPARNTIFLSLALGWAEAAGARDLYIGVNALDYSGYPDCRPEFIAGFEKLAELATKAGVEGEPFRIRAPLVEMSKADIVRKGMELGLDLGLSWSCYDPAPGGVHCGLCDSCRLRSKGFEEAGVPDPTRYAAPA
ncbi:7-cyano-7-deazaguanine synthase QueC [Sphingomonas sp. MG17]|uniref:7-cyano-7-deazaguanine synthase n=1 Tax=Sphingomonas tagetis TaxID=2949092 RepID=A0A9X2HMM0_9SPHN|nr:7-cyano-7-deazaguanine synthase QueC [Sphingomonas tagetis]MCP3730113.1 7-cyano-7-deazaguanine synthase QueC [Sphingomonas tagetis]